MSAAPRLLLVTGLLVLGVAVHAETVVVIANENVPRVDVATLQRVFTGRTISVKGVTVVPVNGAPGSPARDAFLREVLLQDEEKYQAYWTVRRFIGKGVPPPELRNGAEVAQYVRETPGAIGYVAPSDLPPGSNVLIRR